MSATEQVASCGRCGYKFVRIDAWHTVDTATGFAVCNQCTDRALSTLGLRRERGSDYPDWPIRSSRLDILRSR